MLHVTNAEAIMLANIRILSTRELLNATPTGDLDLEVRKRLLQLASMNTYPQISRCCSTLANQGLPCPLPIFGISRQSSQSYRFSSAEGPRCCAQAIDSITLDFLPSAPGIEVSKYLHSLYWKRRSIGLQRDIGLAVDCRARSSPHRRETHF